MNELILLAGLVLVATAAVFGMTNLTANRRHELGVRREALGDGEDVL